MSNMVRTITFEGAGGGSVGARHVPTIYSDRRLLDQIAHRSLIVGVFGRRGSGKTAKGFSLLDAGRLIGHRPAFVLRFPRSQERLLPTHVRIVDDMAEAPRRAMVLVDETSLFYFGGQTSRVLFNMMATARHRDQTLIFTAVTGASIDLNIIRLLDVVIFCRPSRFAESYERERLEQISRKARAEFEALNCEDSRPYAYVSTEEYEGMVRFDLPSYFTEALSKYLGSVTPAEPAPQPEKARARPKPPSRRGTSGDYRRRLGLLKLVLSAINNTDGSRQEVEERLNIRLSKQYLKECERLGYIEEDRGILHVPFRRTKYTLTEKGASVIAGQLMRRARARGGRKR